MATLSKRLQAVAAMVAPCKSLADIGSDHAYLPVHLIGSGTVSFVVAGEVKPGPLAAAMHTVAAAGMEDRISVRKGDGLQVLQPDEVEAVVLAGMGGSAIRGILSRSPAVTASLRRLICQPMSGAAGLRQWLLHNGWRLVREDLVLEDGRLYEIIVAEPGEMEPMEPLLLDIGPLLWQNRHPLLPEHLRRMLKKAEIQGAAMMRSGNPAVLPRLHACQEKIHALEGRIRCL